MAKRQDSQRDDPFARMRAATEKARRAHLCADDAVSTCLDFQPWLGEVSPKYFWGWAYQEFLYERLHRITSGDTDRLMVFMPPRHAKSTTVTVHYAAWRLERDPTLRIIIGAYAQKLANRFSRHIRRLLVGRVALSEERNSASEWETAAGGGVLAVGVGAGVTGYGADLIIIDDPVKNRVQAESETYRERTKDWFDADLYTRLEPNGAIILINTRWHCEDLSGQLLNEEEEGGDIWEVVSLPALAEENDPLGRQPGEALCPERFSVAALSRIRARSSPYDWASLYQQQPVPNEGAVFKIDWFKRIEDRAPEGLRWVRYYDLAASTKSHADYTASAAVAFDRDGTLYIRDMMRGRWEWPDARKEIVTCMKREARTIHGVEEALHGLAAVQELRRERSLVNIPFRGVRVTKDKLSRALAWAERAAEGKVVLVRGPWIGDFLKEVATFTGRGDAHDDQIDSVSGGVEMLAKGGRGRVAVF